jgi:hypothetical protein
MKYLILGLITFLSCQTLVEADETYSVKQYSYFELNFKDEHKSIFMTNNAHEITSLHFVGKNHVQVLNNHFIIRDSMGIFLNFSHKNDYRFKRFFYKKPYLFFNDMIPQAQFEDNNFFNNSVTIVNYNEVWGGSFIDKDGKIQHPNVSY